MMMLATAHIGYSQIPLHNRCATIEPPAPLTLMQPDTIVNGDSVIIIPTVFHILTQGGAENISKSHVMRALEVLNQDFNRQNPDTIDIPAPFHPLRGNPKVEFRLARLDTNGNCTDGIDRIYTPQTDAFNNYSQMQTNFSWDHTRYMNIYIAKRPDQNSNFAAGIAYLPPIDSGQNPTANYDVLMVAYWDLPDGFNGSFIGSRGHTIGHEMGHHLGLHHTWRDAGCILDDEVADTPLQDNNNDGCPVFLTFPVAMGLMVICLIILWIILIV